MMFKNRTDVMNFIVDCESKFPVNDWKFNNIHLWPFLRIQLFFFLRNVAKNEQKEVSASRRSENLTGPSLLDKTLLKLFRAFKYLAFRGALKSRTVVCYGYRAHRVDYNGERFNRFFDTLILEGQIPDDYYFLEKDGKKRFGLFRSERVIPIEKIFQNFMAYYSFKKRVVRPKVNVSLENYEGFSEYLRTFQSTKAFADKFTGGYIRNWAYMTLSVNIEFYSELFKRIKPKILYLLYYYGDFALLAVANRMRIETVEMQHGAQTHEHLAYGSWTKVPDEGYDFLPRTFWSWNESSRKVIENWAAPNPLYRCFVGGNPWVNLWKSKHEYFSHKNFILYTLQPGHSIDKLFPGFLISAVKSRKYVWFIRLHPRQLDSRAEIERFLAENNILELANLSDATNTPLPVLLQNCLIHITNSSASAIEASMFNKMTVFLDEIGKLYFADLIDSGWGSFVADNQLMSEIDKCVNKQSY